MTQLWDFCFKSFAVAWRPTRGATNEKQTSGEVQITFAAGSRCLFLSPLLRLAPGTGRGGFFGTATRVEPCLNLRKAVLDARVSLKMSRGRIRAASVQLFKRSPSGLMMVVQSRPTVSARYTTAEPHATQPPGFCCLTVASPLDAARPLNQGRKCVTNT